MLAVSRPTDLADQNGLFRLQCRRLGLQGFEKAQSSDVVAELGFRAAVTELILIGDDVIASN